MFKDRTRFCKEGGERAFQVKGTAWAKVWWWEGLGVLRAVTGLMSPRWQRAELSHRGSEPCRIHRRPWS